MNRLSAFVVLFAVLLNGCSTSPVRMVPSASAPVLPSTTVYGFSLRDAVTGEALGDQEATRGFVPASVTKLFTALHALSTLGERYTFRTRLWTKGTVKNGVLTGELMLQGGGDPVLAASDLLALAYRLKANKIQRVVGHSLYDEARFVSARNIRDDADLLKPFNSGVSALSVEFNQAAVFDRNGNRFVLPPVLEIPNDHLKEAPRPAAREGCAEEEEARKTRIAVEDPALYTANLFHFFCNLVGVELPSFQKGRLDQHRLLVTHESPPLRHIVDGMLEHSNNTVAELIGLAAVKRPRASLADSGRALDEWIRGQRKGHPSQPLHFENASGLTRKNLISPSLTTDLLVRWMQNPSTYALPSRLPIGGWKGTLSNRFRDPRVAFRVWAKTGTLEYVSALAGYYFSKSGRTVAFSLFMQDDSLWAQRQSQKDPSMDEVAWRKLAVKLQENLILRWLEST